MSTTAQHTAGISPLPWSIGGNGIGYIEPARMENAIICEFDKVEGPFRLGDSMTKANAEYIVKACNLFPGLVEALEACVANMEGFTQRAAGKPSAMQEARDILARVKDENFGQASPSLVP